MLCPLLSPLDFYGKGSELQLRCEKSSSSGTLVRLPLQKSQMVLLLSFWLHQLVTSDVHLSFFTAECDAAGKRG